MEEEPPSTAWPGLGGLRGPGPGVRSKYPWLYGLGCMGGGVPTPPVTSASREPLWLGGGWGMGEVLLDTVNLISLFKKIKGKEKSNTCQRRRLWSLTVLRKGCSGGRRCRDLKRPPSELPSHSTGAAEFRGDSGLSLLCPAPRCPHLQNEQRRVWGTARSLRSQRFLVGC